MPQRPHVEQSVIFQSHHPYSLLTLVTAPGSPPSMSQHLSQGPVPILPCYIFLPSCPFTVLCELSEPLIPPEVGESSRASCSLERKHQPVTIAWKRNHMTHWPQPSVKSNLDMFQFTCLRALPSSYPPPPDFSTCLLHPDFLSLHPHRHTQTLMCCSTCGI